MTIALQLEAADERLHPVDYRWDAETEILSARLRAGAALLLQGSEAAQETVELCGTDGSWLMLDLRARAVQGVDVAIWPVLTTRPGLRPPEAPGAARALLREDGHGPGGITTFLGGESDPAGATLHFRVGRAPVASTLRLGGDLLLDLDARSRLAGLWLLNVPPSPAYA